jgi:enterochelin esterase family protein
MTQRKAVPFIALFPLFLMVGCSSSDPPASTGSGGTVSTAGSGGSTNPTTGSGGATGSGGSGNPTGSGGTTGSGGNTDAAADSGANDVAGDTRTDGASVESGVMDPGSQDDGRFQMMRPATPPEVSGRLPGVMAGMTQTVQVPAAMGFSARSVTVYTPAGYVPNTPIAFMVIHDGTQLRSAANVDIVFDNLAFQKKMPPTVAIYVPNGGSTRSREFDTVNINYSQYVTTQVLPAVAARNIKLTTDPEASGTIGHSSGGILAFTQAWFQPERYRRVLSLSGSFLSLQQPGGAMYDSLIRTTMPLKPIRVAMTAGTNDLSCCGTTWYAANETMGRALMAAGYHYRYIVVQNGSHNQNSNLQWMADLLTWLWRGYPASGPTQ